MAHYALLDENNVVTQVFVGPHENDLIEGVASWEEYFTERHGQTCKRTSYNTVGNQHLLPGGEPFRYNYASIGGKYDPEKDGFFAPQPYPSWVLNEDSLLWEPPVPIPDVDAIKHWNEETQEWDLEYVT